MKIIESTVRTQLGISVLRIYDNNPDVNTPDLHRPKIRGGIELEQGDSGQSNEGLPTTSKGSFFNLVFDDNKNNEFSSLFKGIFDESRFTVELEIKDLGT